MNKRLSLFHAITVVQQIATAVAYLHECGYIHSNISSGTVLMRRYPYAVKLTSFELATEVADTVRKDIENRYGSTSSSRNSMTSSQNEELKKITTYSRLIKNDEQFLRDKYRKLSREVSECRRKSAGGSMGDSSAYDLQASRYLAYCKEYREKFSLFYYVAPELLVPKANFVFPTVQTDVYSLTLLLWEILNGYVPFVVYSRQELEKLQVSGACQQLPMFEKERCDHFRSVFETGLADLSGRKLTVADILDTLDCLLLEQDSEKRTQLNGFADDYEERMDSSEVRKKNELNDVRKQNAMEKTDKKYFQSSDGYVNTENLTRSKQRPVKPARKINKPKPEKDETKKSPFGSSFNLSNSTLYQTIFDFNNKFLSPRSSKQVIYERTSTVKKHKKPTRAGKKAAKELFEPTTLSSRTGSFHNLSDSKKFDEVDKHAVGKTQEVIGPLEVYCKESPAKMNINSEKAKFLKETILDKDGSAYDRTNEVPQSVTSKSCDSSPGTRRKSLYPSKLSNSMRFTIGDITLPDTPIARKNKIRKHAWLSDQKLGIAEGNTSTPVTPQGRRVCSFFNDLGSRRTGGRSEGEFCSPLNLNISSSMQEIKPKKINISVNIIKSSAFGNQLKACSADFSKTSPAIVDIDIDEPVKERSQKAESVHNIFEDTLWKKEKELCERSQHRRSTNDLGEAHDTSASVITAHLTSVRDTVRKIESTFENTGFDYSPIRKSIADSGKKVEVEKKISEESVVVEENLLIPTKILELEKTIEQCTPTPVEPKPSVSHLDVVLTNNTQKKKEELLQHQQHPETPLFNPNSQLFIRRKATNGTAGSVIQRTVYRESIVSSSDLAGLDTPTQAPPGSARKTKLTTRVTVNMRKISRRASDIGTSPVPSRPSSFVVEDESFQPPPASSPGCATPTNAAAAPFRHSCGNDLLKAIAAVRSSSANEMRPTSSAAADRKNMCTPVKGGPRGDRLVCCNCGSSMVPADSLNVPTGSRIGMSAAFSEINFPRESLPSMFDENRSFFHMHPPGTPSSRHTLMPPNARSTEDLYIDDDFCQGLGANMELLVDDGHYLDEFDYDIYTEETIYDTEEDDVKVGELQNVPGPEEEQLFVSKCADLNPTGVDAIGSVFSPVRPNVDGGEDRK
uniref:Protein kinase domain-containing protein n=2 Tax=Culex tarsalis TaxID=7177 RepID=A0A1Q3F190_CULTA